MLKMGFYMRGGGGHDKIFSRWVKHVMKNEPNWICGFIKMTG